ncbi:multicopper oxidase domain-containing protein [Rhodococcus triatomae]|uniref:Multicopper oxidase with three cupredoxin domains (Includes cell division protein FtsP and spore coat protein CotA) n=1 Tax=Rhodococcus triatomae TaxID=300028 RepID=A0A1G8PPM8_9NOCA|nr:multicopper oxidase domain-containing protein [Rhodococcus triatomae]QNG20161.1 multicopper oxidase domain-containing protein [Rhodococcus triatomae]QNG23923.1 multicopper oxidase domain-containing protein [Rhodococcus triatomae]SDI94352.1 Multicopper oxidase with three cupredoxin domains (includes cell division protein FtsP and spore coat protein CotA) [Rhodococcus triatomae]
MDETGGSRRRRSPWRQVVAGVSVAALFVVTVSVAAFVYFWVTAPVNTAGQVEFTRALQIPELAESTVEADGTRRFALEMQTGTADLGRGPATQTWGVNGDYLGPTLRADRGEPVRVDVTNELGEVSTLHWHGMHVPAAMDGGPHQMVEPGETWSPHWTVDQPAATLWYHPHLHGSTAEHVYRGIAGMFYIDDPNGPVLPDRYGIDDIPVIVQDKKFDGDQLSLADQMLSSIGILGDEILVNGTPGPYLDVSTERVRLRVLNASNARAYDFGFDTGLTFTLIASDGGLLPEPVELDSLQLSPGERAEIVVEVPPGTSTVLRSTPPDLGADFWNSRFGGGVDTMDVLELRSAAALENNPEIPRRLTELDDLGEPTVTRSFKLSSNAINGRAMDMTRIDAAVEVDTTELWEVRNTDGQPHNFHVHDVQFRVLDTDDPALSGAKDTVYVRPGETVRLLMRFEDYTDPAVPYMFHCHVLRHEDQGMMGQFVVVGPGERPAVIDHDAHAGHR